MLRALVAVSGVAVLLLSAVLARADEGAITLSPGWNAVTWNGAAPYAIADFADTPVTKVHRWDAVRQEWLSRFVGRDGGRLPELHLLPRVQYLLVAEGKYELDVPDPIAGIDPYAALSAAVAPDDPLRFEAYWPNEDSPLEDLVVLRGEDERLSVRAEVTGGVGDVEVYWVIDGRLNYTGMASEEVALNPGAHDGAIVLATDRNGEVAVRSLPRIVRLPKLELPSQFLFGTFIGTVCLDDDSTSEAYDHKLALVKDAGFTMIRGVDFWPSYDHWGVREVYAWTQTTLDCLARQGIEQFMSIAGTPKWAAAFDVSRQQALQDLRSLAPVDPADLQDFTRTLARLYPNQRFWQIGNEPNLQEYQVGVDPYSYVTMLKAAALGLWYEQPEAVIILSGITGVGWTDGEGGFDLDGAINGGLFLEALYRAGVQRWHDISAIHYASDADLDTFRAIMAANGDDDKHLWVTESGTTVRTGDAASYQAQAEFLRDHLRIYRERADIHAVMLFMLGGDDPAVFAPCVDRVGHNYCILEPMTDPTSADGGILARPAYWAVREFISGQPSSHD